MTTLRRWNYVRGADLSTGKTAIIQLVATIKRELKAQGLTYRDVARSLRVSARMNF